MAKERIQKILAAAGYGARRACELLVLDGRVTVNGERVRTLPILADASTDKITVDGRPIRAEKLAYYLLNKPPGVLCTHKDPAGRRLAVNLLVGVRERVYPVGRLDADSMGLLIMTNDGALAQKLTHPRFGVPKTYRAEVLGCPTAQTLERLRAGIRLAEGKTAPARITVIHKRRDRAMREITLREGRNREVRRMLAKTGHKVQRLTRIRIGTLSIRKLPLGAFRRLLPAEVRYLQSLADRLPATATGPRTRGRAGPTRAAATARTRTTATPRRRPSDQGVRGTQAGRTGSRRAGMKDAGKKKTPSRRGPAPRRRSR